jgi:hypothetical protein
MNQQERNENKAGQGNQGGQKGGQGWQSDKQKQDIPNKNTPGSNPSKDRGGQR